MIEILTLTCLQEPDQLDQQYQQQQYQSYPQHQPQESIYYQDGAGMTVTSSRIIYGHKIIFLANLSSVRIVEISPVRIYPALLVAFGIVGFIAGVNMLREGGMGSTAIAFFAVAVTLMLAGGIWLVALKPNYSLKLGSGPNEFDWVVSEDQGYIETIAAAVNRAMSGRYY